jgi:hypothetical protein
VEASKRSTVKCMDACVLNFCCYQICIFLRLCEYGDVKYDKEINRC